MNIKKIFNVLSIAGSDPSGGAGIQADLKTFSALGVYGTTVITTLTAQNTYGVQSIYPISASCVDAQLESIFNDIHIHSIKIGLLSKANIVEIIIKKIIKYQIPWIVLDTVMIAKNGYKLVDKKALNIIKEKLIPLVSIITPNLIEAALLLDGIPAKNEEQIINQGKKLLSLGCKVVIIKGGHLLGPSSPDWFITQNQEIRISSNRVNTKNTHGTGCTLSAAIAAKIPYCKDWLQAFKEAKTWIYQTLINANNLSIGKGSGPLHHFYKWW
ncbi:bifunctional hydroxymethylpyrimidine kinase/phosphomethylpyrimidine kinase (plasmid) [Candidatus Pantoea edessiphila]|uniref:hydroxymethylpyrimidine kinase n=1 Tax=Candidatus Pantoea edessiphila TaxID=2044610 RepID=A0A2P5T193_9GAMM|nr:bifunctional hydroxymethylpyrimidine kinase/phosphomethylpyrimidine kinase [Candidatus Pantoea edessiphila]PPI88330.1 bifunctional hydroxymethylpyrimidine kinase/phosphomethylpyrimidine kinase [Candidatus Pantoea edessiphila]